MTPSQVVGLAFGVIAAVVSIIGFLAGSELLVAVGLIAAVVGLILLTLRWEDAFQKSPHAASTSRGQRLADARE